MISHCQHTKGDFVDFTSGEVLMDFETSSGFLEFLYGDSDFMDCMKIIHSDQQRYNRLFLRVKYMMDLGQCMFLTLTFNEETLNSSSAESRHNWVKRFLKRNFNCYVANIDFGKKTQREHFHAIVLGDDLKSVEKWKYGYSSAKYIYDNKESSERISHYLLKLAYHFVKDTVKRNKVIYSRDTWKYNPVSFPFYKPKKVIPEDKQLCFWDHLPSNFSNFDLEDYE